MARSLGLRILAGVGVLLPGGIAAILAAACGGSDFIDAPDALVPDASTTDGASSEGSASDAELANDGSTADGALSDAGGLESLDGDARLDANVDARIDAGVKIDASTNLDAGVTVDASVNIDAEVDGALLDAEAGLDADTGVDAGHGPPNLLGSAKNFAVLAGTTITITPLPTVILGDVGVSPGTAIVTLPTGQPVGAVFAGGPVALQAQTDLTIAYNALAGRPCIPANNMSGVDLGGKTLAPGVYCFNASAALTGGLVLDAQLDPGAVWVIQVGSALTTATIASVSVINGGSACNVYWQIGSSATLGTGTTFVGNIVALTSITLVTGATVPVGRTLARNGEVALDGNTISTASCP